MEISAANAFNYKNKPETMHLTGFILCKAHGKKRNKNENKMF